MSSNVLALTSADSGTTRGDATYAESGDPLTSPVAHSYQQESLQDAREIARPRDSLLRQCHRILAVVPSPKVPLFIASSDIALLRQ